MTKCFVQIFYIYENSQSRRPKYPKLIGIRKIVLLYERFQTTP